MVSSSFPEVFGASKTLHHAHRGGNKWLATKELQERWKTVLDGCLTMLDPQKRKCWWICVVDCFITFSHLAQRFFWYSCYRRPHRPVPFHSWNFLHSRQLQQPCTFHELKAAEFWEFGWFLTGFIPKNKIKKKKKHMLFGSKETTKKTSLSVSVCSNL